MAKKAKKVSGMVCTCGPGNIAYGVIAAVIMAIGVYFVVTGFVLQFNNAAIYWAILLWYAAGLLVMWTGKRFKCKMYGCQVHG